jgi:hypothetical protein
MERGSQTATSIDSAVTIVPLIWVFQLFLLSADHVEERQHTLGQQRRGGGVVRR